MLLSRKTNQKFTLGKLKKKGMIGKPCTKCGWRKIISEFSDKCPHCKEIYGI